MDQDSMKSIISEKVCAKIISKYLGHSDVQIIDYEVKPFSNEVNGFMGDHLSIVIKYCAKEETATLSFFAKRFPYQHELQSQYALLIGAFTREIFTYSFIFEEYKKWKGFDENLAPKFYFGKDNDIIVFEDLSPLGYRTPRNYNNLSLDHIKLALKVLAKYHAGGIAYQEMKSEELGKKYQILDDYPHIMEECFFREDPDHLSHHWYRGRMSALKALINLLPHDEQITKAKFKEGLESLGKKAIEILRPNKSYYNLLCHGDMWGKNLLYRYVDEEPVDCKLIDFQMERFCQPAHDALQLIFFTTDTEGRQHHFADLLKYYYNCLKSELRKGDINIDKVLTYNDFDISVNYLMPQIKLQTAAFLSFQCANQDFHKRVTSNLDEFKRVIFGDGAPFAVELYRTDTNYKNLMTQTLKELKYQILFPRVSLEDCFKIIQSKLNTTKYTLKNYNYKPLSSIGGYLGDHYKLKIDIITNGVERTLNFFVKSSPESKTRYDLAISAEAFVKEVFATKILFPLFIKNGIEEIQQCVVPVHLDRVNDVIIFDDLEYENYSSLSARRCLSYEELLLVIPKLAAFHASSIILEEKMSKGRNLYRIGDHFKTYLMESFYARNDQACSKGMEVGFDSFDHIIDLFPEINQVMTTQVFKEKVNRASEDTFRLVKRSNKFRNVVCHGDLWASNIMFKYEKEKPIDCLLIDYQILRYCPPSHDLLCFLYLTTSRDVMKQHKYKLMEYYYKHFSDMIRRYKCDVEEIYSFETFLESCDYMEVQAVCQTLAYHQMIMADSDLMKEYTFDEEKSNYIFMVNRDPFITDMCTRDPVYRERIKEALENILDICVKKYS